MEVEKRTMVNGGVKLPIGYRFHPTDQELIFHYLLPKAFASPLPSSIIPVFDVFSSHPLTFPGDEKEKQRYLFCKKRREMTSNRIKISSGDGYWKTIGKERQIFAYGRTVGIKRTLSFNETSKPSSNCNKTRWSMTEYRLYGFASTERVLEEWAVYNVHERKASKGRRQRKSRGRYDEEDLSCIDFTVGSDHETGPPPPSPPTSADESGSII